MNTLVIYDSQYGNTELVAEMIAPTSRKFGPVRVRNVEQAVPTELGRTDLLLLGSPT